jgi:pimeloyl-ACP methyl ester carboxylesterase
MTTTGSPPKTFILVHGAWHGGWCYRRVADVLIRAGHRVFAPTLTGLGERSHLYDAEINLTVHIEDVSKVLHYERLGDVTLVGHSYGGMVVTGVAARHPEKINSLVYLDAFIPGHNQSLHDLVPEQDARAQRESATSQNRYSVAPIAAEVFNVNPADRAWVDSLCTPQPLSTFTERLPLTDAIERVTRKIYVLATGNPMVGLFRTFRDVVARRPGWRSYELACGHDVMIDLPGETAEILLSVDH